MPTHEELTQGVVNLERRVAKLDEWAATVKHHGDQIDGLLGDVERNRKLVARIEALEKNERLQAIHRSADEEVRKDRWHATRDAALGDLIFLEVQGCSDGSIEDEDPVGTALKQANDVADRAHGPLEADPERIHNTGYLDQINALVKAARAIATDNWAHGPGFQLPKDLQATTVEHVRKLVEALKPFEQEANRG